MILKPDFIPEQENQLYKLKNAVDLRKYFVLTIYVWVKCILSCLKASKD